MSEMERIARLEESSSGIKSVLERLERKVDGMAERMASQFASRVEMGELTRRVNELERQHEKRGTLPAWAASFLTFLITALMFFAGLYFKK